MSNPTTTITTPSDLAKLKFLLRSLVDLARLVFHPPASPIQHISKLLGIQNQLNHHFTKYSHSDFSTGDSAICVVEMQTLVSMIEIALEMSHREVQWPKFMVEEKEKEKIQKRVFVEIERVVFGRFVSGSEEAGGGEKMEIDEEEEEEKELERRERRRVSGNPV